MKLVKRKRLATVGRRTGVDLKDKKIRMLADGVENFDDYWSASESSDGGSSSYICPPTPSPSRCDAQRIRTLPILPAGNLLPPSSKQKTKKQNIFVRGRRTGAHLLDGKTVRMKNGLENFDDYWSDTTYNQSALSRYSKRSVESIITEKDGPEYVKNSQLINSTPNDSSDEDTDDIPDKQEETKVRRSIGQKVVPLEHWKGQHMSQKVVNGEIITVIEDGRAEITDNIQDQQKEIPVRRSTRQKIAPLEHWRGQHMIQKVVNGEIITVIEDGRPEDTKHIEKIIKRYDRKGKQNRKKQEPKIFENEMNKHKIKENIDKIPIINPYTQEEEYIYLHRPYKTLTWECPNNQDENNPAYLISKCFTGIQKFVSFGYIEIEVSKCKEAQYSPNDNITFCVIQGKVKIKIFKNSVHLREKDVIIVPMCNSYSIENTGKVNALLYYCTYKTPIFAYQCSQNSNDDEEENV